MIIFAISIKSTILAFFHLIIHALFKSTIFLCAGFIIHNFSYQDIRIIDTKTNISPLTSSILGLSRITLIGLPFTSGFFSKDIIIEILIRTKSNFIISLLIISSIGITASYTIRISFLSNKHLSKSKPDTNFHKNIYTNIPITLISLISIPLGAIIIWITNPHQIFIFPNSLKTTIIRTLLIGALIGLFLSFKSKNYKKLGESSISLWFSHFLTTNFSTKSNNLSFTLSKNDKSWQELYGPTNLYNLIKNQSKTLNSIKLTLILSTILLTIIPITLIYHYSLSRALYWR